MSTRINTNVTAFEAARNLSMNSDKLSQNIERLSSGMRINSAADDAAGLVISQNMKAQLTGLNQATSNTNDAINMVKTAEGALNEVHSLLMSMRQLAVQASNSGVNAAVDLTADQTQINSAINSINRIASTTQFSSKKLLDGSATSASTTTSGTAALASGGTFNLVSQGNWVSGNNAYTYTNSTLTAATASTNTNAVTAQSGTTALSSTSALFSGSVTVNGQAYNLTPSGGAAVNLSTMNSAIATSGYTASITGSNLVFTSNTTGKVASPGTFNTSALTVDTQAASALGTGTYTAGGAAAKAVESFANTGLTTSAATTANTFLNSTGSLTLNDQGSATASSVTVAYTAGESLAALATAVQSATATFTNGKVNTTLTAGGALQFQSNANGADGAGAAAHLATFLNSDGSTTPTVYAKQTSVATAGTYANGANASLALDDGSGHTITSAVTSQVGSGSTGTNYFQFSNGLVLSAAANATSPTATLTTTAGASSVGQDLQFQIGANGGQSVSQSIASVAADQLGKSASSYTDANGSTQSVYTDSIKNINVSTFKGAQDAIAVIDKAISDISTARANLGAFQSNVLESNVRSLGVENQNVKSSMSTIVDTDLSAEIVDYTKNQILVQAGTSALGQANQAPQAILKLLQ